MPSDLSRFVVDGLGTVISVQRRCAAGIATSDLFVDGEHVVRGFGNANIREALYGTTTDPAERRRQSAAVGRLFKRLRVRGRIRKVPRT